jgi:hypothetical protein
MVFHCGDAACVWLGCMFYGIRQMLFNNRINTAVQSGAEQQALSASWNLRHQVINDWQKSHVSHLICFIENCDLNFRQIAISAIN